MEEDPRRNMDAVWYLMRGQWKNSSTEN